MIDPDFLLERIWFAVSPDGTEFTFAIRISAPRLQPQGEWTSTVSLSQGPHGLEDIHGMDSWQAVELSMRHAAWRIEHLQNQGWRFYWDNINRETASPSELFSGSRQ